MTGHSCWGDALINVTGIGRTTLQQTKDQGLACVQAWIRTSLADWGTRSRFPCCALRTHRVRGTVVERSVFLPVGQHCPYERRMTPGEWRNGKGSAGRRVNLLSEDA